MINGVGVGNQIRGMITLFYSYSFSFICTKCKNDNEYLLIPITHLYFLAKNPHVVFSFGFVLILIAIKDF